MCTSPAVGRVLVLAVGLAILAATGCGGSAGTVSGSVSYNNAPVKGGSVILIPADGSGESFSGTIQEDGTYSIPGVRGGKYKVCVDTSFLKPAAKGSYGGPKVAPGKMKNEPPKGVELPAGYKMNSHDPAAAAENARRYVQIPSKYADATQTPLQVDVSGTTKFDIPLS